MRNQLLTDPIRIAAVLFACTGGISLAAGPTAGSSASGGAGNGGAHAAAPAQAAPAAQTPAAAPSAPVRAAPTANPTTPAGVQSNPQALHAQQTPEHATPAASVANGTNRAEHRHQNEGQYQTIYGNFWYPQTESYGTFGNTGIGNTGNNNNFSDNSNDQQTAPAPAPAPVAPTDNSTSIAAQNDNAAKNSPGLALAGDNIQRAQAAYEQDRQRVISGLADRPEYQQAVSRQKDAMKNMSDVKPLGAGAPAADPTPAQMNAASTKLDAAGEVTKMQEDAIAADPKAAADKQALAKLVSERDAQAATLRNH